MEYVKKKRKYRKFLEEKNLWDEFKSWRNELDKKKKN